MKRLLCLLAVLLIALPALASVETTAKVNLRTGPGTQNGVIATVAPGTILEDLDCIMYDDAGTGWYWVRYQDRECWVCATYAVVHPEPQPPAPEDVIALEAFLGDDAIVTCAALNLTHYDALGGSWEYCYYNDCLLVYLTAGRVVALTVNTDILSAAVASRYAILGIRTGDPWYRALDTALKAGLIFDCVTDSYLSLDAPMDADGNQKSLTLFFDPDSGLITRIDYLFREDV